MFCRCAEVIDRWGWGIEKRIEGWELWGIFSNLVIYRIFIKFCIKSPRPIMEETKRERESSLKLRKPNNFCTYCKFELMKELEGWSLFKYYENEESNLVL